MKDLKGNVTIKAFPIEDKLWERIRKNAQSRGVKLYVYLKMVLEAGVDNVGK